VIFEWDDQKASSNLKKHGVSFQEAKTVFGDTFSLTVADPEHSESEYRFIDIGLAESGRLLVVSYTERGTKIRIISSRLALPAERRLYEKG
jgi:uncharacterized protein